MELEEQEERRVEREKQVSDEGGRNLGVNGGKTEHRNNGGLVGFKSGMVGGDVTRMMKYKSCKGRKSIH